MTPHMYRGPEAVELNAILARATHIVDMLLTSFAQDMHNRLGEMDLIGCRNTLLIHIVTEHIIKDATPMEVVSRTDAILEAIGDSVIRGMQKKRDELIRKIVLGIRVTNPTKPPAPNICDCPACQIDAALNMPFGSVVELEFNVPLREVIINGTERRILDQETFDRVHKLADDVPSLTKGGAADGPTYEAPPAQPGGSGAGSPPQS